MTSLLPPAATSMSGAYNNVMFYCNMNLAQDHSLTEVANFLACAIPRADPKSYKVTISEPTNVTIEPIIILLHETHVLTHTPCAGKVFFFDRKNCSNEFYIANSQG